MKLCSVPTMLGMILFTTLTLTLAPAANAGQSHGCSAAGVEGEWGYRYTGTIYLPSASVLIASVGSFSQDQAGHVFGRQTRSVGGSSGEEVIKGHVDVHSDCTGSSVIRVYSGGQLQRTSYLKVVYENGMQQAHWIFTEIVLPDKSILPAVVTIDAYRI